MAAMGAEAGGAYITEINPARSAAWLPEIRPLTGVSGYRREAPMDVTSGMGSTSMSLSLSTQPAHRFGFEEGDGSMSPASALRKTARMSTGGSFPQQRTMRQSQSDSVLHGLSSNADSENVRARRNLQSLGVGRQAPSQVRSTAAKATTGDAIDQEKTIKDFDKLTTAIGEVKTQFDAFDPRRAGRKNVPFSVILAGGKARDEGAGGEVGEDEEALRERQERLAERLQAYKFSRRCEPELPPLARIASGVEPKKPPPQTIVARNASVEAIKVWLPQRRRDRISSFSEEKASRTELCQNERERMIEESAEFWMQDLERKRRQAKEVVEQRKQQAKLQGTSKEFPAAKWMSIICAIGWLEQVRQDLTLKRLPTSERLAYFKENQHKLLMKRSSTSQGQLEEAIQFEAVSASPAVSRMFACTVANIKLKKKIKMSRVSAKTVFAALTTWQVAGQIIFAMKNVVYKARILQRWWRQCSLRLKEQRERIAQRWERLERAELAVELSKWERPTGGRRNSGAQLTLEERIGMEVVSKATRLTFLEHELRARRYFLLPQIASWETECDKWQTEFNKYLELRKAYEAMGTEYGERPEHGFKWPPLRPMHLPPAHPLAETARGAICGFNCPGRKGDEEILNMWRRCRADPTSWKVCPRAGMKVFDKKVKKKDSDKEQKVVERRKSLGSLLDNDRDQEFGDVPEKDMVSYGVDDSTMPGGEPPSESEPRVAPPV